LLTEAKIALRYLFSRKSHNVINVISGISAAGMAVGSAALVIILSVYNGFNDIIDRAMSDFDPDFKVTGTIPDGIHALEGCHGIQSVRDVLEFDAFVSYDEKQSMAKIRGVEDNMLYDGEYAQALVGASLAAKLGVNPRFTTPLTLWFVDRNANISLASPEAALRSAKVWPAANVSISSDLDEELVVVPIGVAQRLYGPEVSAVEIRLEEGSSKTEALHALEGQDCRILDRHAQHPELYRMMKLEKIAVFGIMILIVILIALNVYGSLSMLVIEKKNDIGTLSALGASDKAIRRIFVLEGWMVSAAGMLSGLVVGLAVCLLQQHFGIVRMPGNFLVPAYPVIVKAADITAAAFAILLSGGIISSLVKVPTSEA